MPTDSKIAQRERAWIREAAVGAMLLGLVFVAVPALVSDPELRPALEVLRLPGAVALVAGLTLLGLHVVLDRVNSPQSRPIRSEFSDLPRATSTDGTATNETATNETATAVLPGREPVAVSNPSADPAIAFAPLPAATPIGPNLDLAGSQRFVTLCLALFGQAGLQARVQPARAPGCTEIWLHSRHAPGAPVKVVHCWESSPDPVTLTDVEALWRVMTSSRVARGILATSSGVLPEAERFAADHRIQLLGPVAVQALARALPRAQARD